MALLSHFVFKAIELIIYSAPIHNEDLKRLNAVR